MSKPTGNTPFINQLLNGGKCDSLVGFFSRLNSPTHGVFPQRLHLLILTVLAHVNILKYINERSIEIYIHSSPVPLKSTRTLYNSQLKSSFQVKQ